MKKLLLILSIFFAQNAMGGSTVSTNLTVTANVVNSCVIGVSNLSFPNYSAAEVTAQSTITLTCTNGATYTISADKGTAAGATFANRIMKNGNNSLNYSLYTDSAYTIVWGDGSSSSQTIAGTGTGSSQTVTIYGKIPAAQTSVVAGAYTDTVAVTIAY